jgi:hypothetical protein
MLKPMPNKLTQMRTKKLVVKYFKLLIFLEIAAIIGMSCENSEKTKPDYIGKVILQSCGGTVMQLLDPKNYGESWTNHYTDPTYTYENCVLVGNLSPSIAVIDTIIGFDFKPVTFFSQGNFCDIGGLPNTKIEIVKLYDVEILIPDK